MKIHILIYQLYFYLDLQILKKQGLTAEEIEVWVIATLKDEWS